jgi:two-component system response regulator DevR
MRRIGYTKRERQVLTYIAEGMDNKEIAALLGLKRKTIGNYTMGLYAKTGAANREALFVIARLERPYTKDVA